jgi:hypothetical protein
MCVALIILIQFILLTTSAIAQSPTGAIKEFGLFGIWTDDCKADPSAANQNASFSVTSRGVAQLRNDFGPDYDNMLYRIVDAKRIRQFRISLRQLLTTDDQIVLDIVMLKAKDRVWSSRGNMCGMVSFQQPTISKPVGCSAVTRGGRAVVIPPPSSPGNEGKLVFLMNPI